MNIQDQYQDNIKRLCKTVDSVSWENKQVYGNFLAQTYYYVCHSTRLLSLAASYYFQDMNKLHERFLKHSLEEINHELLALGDLKKLGFSLTDFPELPSTKSFYQTCYYTIERQSPWSFFGYILTLEGLAVARANYIYEIVSGAHGKNTGSFLKVHAADDQDHVQQALQMLKEAPDQDQPFIASHMNTSGFLYCSMLDQINNIGKSISRVA